MIRFARISQEIMLTLGAILGVICILAALGAVFFGVTPLIFRSGSMSPEIATGALALAQEVPANEIRVTDIVSAINPQGTRVTHRVIAVSPRGDGMVAISMQGDANAVADPEPYVVTTADRVIWHLDGVGFVVQEVQKPPYVFAMGLLAGALLVFSVRSRRAARLVTEHDDSDSVPGAEVSADAPDAGGRRKRALVAPTALVLVGVLGAGTFAGGHPVDTMALFTDQTRAVSASLASSLPASSRPTGVSCSGTGTGVGKDLTIAWTAPTLTPNDTTVTASPLTPVTVLPGGTTSVTYPEATITASGSLSFTIVLSTRHFTQWTAPAATYTATITNGSRKVTCSPA